MIEKGRIRGKVGIFSGGSVEKVSKNVRMCRQKGGFDVKVLRSLRFTAVVTQAEQILNSKDTYWP